MAGKEGALNEYEWSEVLLAKGGEVMLDEVFEANGF